MDDRILQFRLGVFVVLIATAVMTLALIFLFGELPQRDQMLLYVRFDKAPGVTVETPVRKNGILIGRVRKVNLLETGGVVLAINIDAGRTLLESEVCRISSDNLFGDAVLEFVASGEEDAATRQLQDGDYLNGVVASNPLDALRVVVELENDLNQTLGSIRTAGEEVGRIAGSLSVLVVNNQAQFNRILGQAERAMGRFETAMTSVNQVVSDEDLQLALEEALDAVPGLVNEAAQVLRGLNRVTDEAERNLINLRGLTDPLGEQGEEIVLKFNQGVGRLDQLMAEITVFAEALNSSEGSLGQFVNNPELYQNLNQAARNIEELSRKLEPIVNDARVAVDKVARNPRMLGVQGALQRRTSGIK